MRLSLSDIETLRSEAFVAGDTLQLALCEVALGQTLTPHHEAVLRDCGTREFARLASVDADLSSEVRARIAGDELLRRWL